MLKRKFRLNAGKRLADPKRVKTESVLVKVVRNTIGYSRFGFVVSKTIDKRATKRNRIKRLMRKYVEDNREKIKDGHDILFVAQGGIKNLEAIGVAGSMSAALTKLNLLT